MLTFLLILKWGLLIIGVIGLFFIIAHIYDHGLDYLLDFSEPFIWGVIFLIIGVSGFFVVGHFRNKFDSNLIDIVQEKNENLGTNVKHRSNLNLGNRKINENNLNNIRKSKDKNFQSYSNEDMNQLISIASEKMSINDCLYEVSEPVYYIIAPMSYSTAKFEKQNSNSEALFGLVKQDKSFERLALLENAISKFENFVDDKVGVSFLDRSKISQIEKEHKFQLSDWSNDKKTAEIGHALNATILLFLDKFSFIDQNGGEYRFEAKFVDLNTMRTATYTMVYRGKNLKPDSNTLARINFNGFKPISSINNPFTDEIKLEVVKKFRTVQSANINLGTTSNACPLVASKLNISEYDLAYPTIAIDNCTSFSFDGSGSIDIVKGDETLKGDYSFEACELSVNKIGTSFYTDGRIGELTIQVANYYEKMDVYTNNNREFYLRFGNMDLPKLTINYYLQAITK